ncbi:hypothetical protein [Leyella stercorea]|uniref:hypothetical protein n=1 Tax=Leyella stercorea TaxID=363265 RepID=UPI002432E73D|nr:hypothetical protein [Leyella stercorea]
MIIEKNCKSIKDILNNDIQVNGIIYSPIFGDLEYLGEDNGLKFRCIKSNNIVIFRENGTYAEGGDILLFPSNENRCWENVPIRYPKTKEELIDMYCKKRNIKLSDWEKMKEQNLYFFLKTTCIFLDSLAVNLKKTNCCNKEWVVYPVYNENNGLNLEWKVKRRTDLFFHFGFYTKTAAEKFIELMKEEIKKWARNVYQFDYKRNDTSDLSDREVSALISMWNKKS